MSFSVVLCLVATTANVLVAAACLSFARVRGWRVVSRIGVIAALSAGYSATNLLFVLPGVSGGVIRAGAAINIAFATGLVIGWIAYVRAWTQRPFGWIDKAAIGALVVEAVGMAAMMPSLRIGAQTFAAVGVTYHTPVLPPAGKALLLIPMAAMAIPLHALVASARAGVKGGRPMIIGFSVYYLLVVTEVLSAARILEVPYLGDLGFVVLVAIAAADAMRRMTRDARALARLNRDLAQEVELRSQQLVDAREALMRSERHAALGHLAAGVGHEINNPLMYVMANVEQVRATLAKPGDAPSAERRALVGLLDEVQDGVDRIARIVRDLSVFTRRDDDGQASARVADVIQSSLRLVRSQLRHSAEVSVQHTDGADIVAAMAAPRLSQVLVNLLVNASHACAGRERDGALPAIRVVTRRRADGWCVIEVIDEGHGMDEQTLGHIFDPYFTTKEVGHGTGLGLYVCHSLVTRVGGRISATSRFGVGTTMSIELPGAKPSPESAKRRQPTAPTGAVVEDDAPCVRLTAPGSP